MYMYVHMYTHTVYCKSFEVEKFCGFRKSISNRKTFPVIACAISYGHTRLPLNRECFPVDYSLVLHTAKLFHLKQFAIHGIRDVAIDVKYHMCCKIK